MAKLVINELSTRKKILPLIMALANRIVKELRFVEIINESVTWDKSHWNITPGGLAKMLVMSTFTDIRVPLSHLEESKITGDFEAKVVAMSLSPAPVGYANWTLRACFK